MTDKTLKRINARVKRLTKQAAKGNHSQARAAQRALKAARREAFDQWDKVEEGS